MTNLLYINKIASVNLLLTHLENIGFISIVILIAISMLSLLKCAISRLFVKLLQTKVFYNK